MKLGSAVPLVEVDANRADAGLVVLGRLRLDPTVAAVPQEGVGQEDVAGVVAEVVRPVIPGRDARIERLVVRL